MNGTMSNAARILHDWESLIFNFLPKLILACLELLCFWFLAHLVGQVCARSLTRLGKTQKSKTFALVVSRSAVFFFLLSGFFIALQILGLEALISRLLAGAGIVGIVAGFAFKDIASNAFSGLLLDIQRPFKTGDWVEISENYGIVSEIGWLTTAIDTVPGQRVFVPNQVVYSGAFTNYSTFGRRRIILSTGVSYGDDLEKVKEEAIGAVKECQSLLSEEPIDFYFTEIDGSSYNFVVRFWTEFHSNDDYQRAMSEVIVRIKKRFSDANISIPFPVTTLDFGVKGGVNLFDKAVSVFSEDHRTN